MHARSGTHAGAPLGRRLQVTEWEGVKKKKVEKGSTHQARVALHHSSALRRAPQGAQGWGDSAGSRREEGPAKTVVGGYFN